MPMDRQHVAAAIERQIELDEQIANNYDTLAKLTRERIEQWRERREMILNEELPEQYVRTTYTEVTGVIVLGE
jgi:hypothetical protein